MASIGLCMIVKNEARIIRRCLESALPLIDYGLMIDADEVLVYEAGFNAGRFKRGMHCSLYDIQTRYADIVYTRPQLFSNRLEFHYKAVLHEFLDCAHIPSRA